MQRKPIKRGRPKIDNLPIYAEIERLWYEGYGYGTIAKMLGLGTQQVRYHIVYRKKLTEQSNQEND